MNKYNEHPHPCIYCNKPTAFGSGHFVNRIPADTDMELKNGTIEYRDGYACAKCMMLECDRCGEPICIDEDICPYDIYRNDRIEEFADGAYKVHYECLTPTELKQYEYYN